MYQNILIIINFNSDSQYMHLREGLKPMTFHSKETYVVEYTYNSTQGEY